MARRGEHAERETRKRRRLPAWLPVLVMLVGLAIAAYPLASELAYQAETATQTSQVEDSWKAADESKVKSTWNQAVDYNRTLAGKRATHVRHVRPYAKQLVYNAWPYMCYLKMADLGIELPVYHGTTEEALSSGAGHLEGTSLPVGGRPSNCCISAHSGISSARMFDGLRDARKGQLVELRTLGKSLWYEVSKVKIVDPDDTSSLEIVPGHDRLTLITCTSDPMPGMPRGGYGINDRRLVVVCERTAAPAEPPAMTPHVDERVIWPLVAALVIAAILVLGWLLTRHRTRKRAALLYGPWKPGTREARCVRRATGKALKRAKRKAKALSD